MSQYKILSIAHSGTKGTRGLPREDGKYPMRIGRIVEFEINNISIGIPLILNYIKDENGNDYRGRYLRCSTVCGIHFIGDSIWCIETRNTIYEFEKI